MTFWYVLFHERPLAFTDKFYTPQIHSYEQPSVFKKNNAEFL